jgi:MFS family permease
MFVQMIGLLFGAPFIVLCGITTDVFWLMVALTAWGFFKGLYDANIFASVFDVVRPEARGTVAGFMNCIGWLGGAGTAPIIVGYVAQQYSLGTAIALGSVVYLLGVALLVIGMVFFVKRDAERMQAALVADATV